MKALAPFGRRPPAGVGQAGPRGGWALRVAIVASSFASSSSLLRTLAGLALAFLLLRLAVLAAVLSDAEIGLHVDEAQYLHWSQILHWGYYSKPPGVVALIAASTALLGDGLVGVKLLVMACHPLAAAVTGALAYAMGLAALADSRPGEAVATPADAALARRVAVAAGLLVASSPLASLLGLVATTDGPLMLLWALGAAAGWRFARHGRRRDALWLGLALGLGLLSKYTALALLPSLVGLVFAARPAMNPTLEAALPASAQRRGALAGFGLAAGVALLLLLPHLLWNAQHGWPTLRHTLDITAQAGRGPAGSAGRSAAEFVAGQVLMFGPLWLLALPAGLRRVALMLQS